MVVEKNRWMVKKLILAYWTIIFLIKKVKDIVGEIVNLQEFGSLQFFNSWKEHPKLTWIAKITLASGFDWEYILLGI